MDECQPHFLSVSYFSNLNFNPLHFHISLQKKPKKTKKKVGGCKKTSGKFIILMWISFNMQFHLIYSFSQSSQYNAIFYYFIHFMVYPSEFNFVYTAWLQNCKTRFREMWIFKNGCVSVHVLYSFRKCGLGRFANRTNFSPISGIRIWGWRDKAGLASAIGQMEHWPRAPRILKGPLTSPS